MSSNPHRRMRWMEISVVLITIHFLIHWSSNEVVSTNNVRAREEIAKIRVLQFAVSQ